MLRHRSPLGDDGTSTYLTANHAETSSTNGSSHLGNGSLSSSMTTTTSFNGSFTSSRSLQPRPSTNDRGRSRNRSHRRKAPWKKLLWVKQSYPDNFTDAHTFLDQIKLNPSWQPYEFWPLVADTTVIVQHVCSVIIFVCCFTGIYQHRISPVSVVGWASLGAVLGWILWDQWVGQEEEAAQRAATRETASTSAHLDLTDGAQSSAASSSTSPVVETPTSSSVIGLGLNLPSINMPTQNPQPPSQPHARNGPSHKSSTVSTAAPSPASTGHPTGAPTFALPPHTRSSQRSMLSPRNQQRLATLKSAVLIYCALLGLSPILKSLTMSTAKDSIWALSAWLMFINVCFFDYSSATSTLSPPAAHRVWATTAAAAAGQPGTHPAAPSSSTPFPASMSTNAALMASTVLASRLESTTDVFSLTLFSIQVFGLFPVFRRDLRQVSWTGHMCLTLALILGASGGLSVVVTGGAWLAALGGVLLGGILIGLAMGLASWWLIGLQKYKNEIYGPWDPARPLIRRTWE